VAAIEAAVGALVLAALGVALAVILSSGGSTTRPTATIVARATSSTITVQAVTPSASAQSSATAASRTVTRTVTSTSPTPIETPHVNSGTVTGQDASGFDVGAGCSDNPNSPLPGCSDSPSVPNSDPEGTCPNGVTVDKQTTSCGLAESVYSNYIADGTVTGYSSERGRDYTFTCTTGGPGTTRYTICEGHADSATLYLRFQK
jgi:hypothetical protein